MFLLSSLNKDPTALGILREKLFILWGDLEERKSHKFAQLQPIIGGTRKRKFTSNSQYQEKSRSARHGHDDEEEEEDDENGGRLGNKSEPITGKFFEALVREYGVEKKGSDGETHYVRMFNLYGVTIR